MRKEKKVNQMNVKTEKQPTKEQVLLFIATDDNNLLKDLH